MRETVERQALGWHIEDREGAFGCLKAVVGRRAGFSGMNPEGRPGPRGAGGHAGADCAQRADRL